MNLNDVLAFVTENPVCTFTTMDNDQPRARGFLTVLFDDGKLYFTTGTNKSVYDQLKRNPKVELCYFAKDFMTQLRITGEVEFVDDRAKKQKLLDERDYLKGIGTVDNPIFKLLRIAHGKARFWTIKDNMREQGLETVDV